MDHSTVANATAMFTYEQQQTAASVAVPGYAAGTAIGYPALTGITVYAHFSATYIELQLDGYPDPAQGAAAAGPLLKALEAKANSK